MIYAPYTAGPEDTKIAFIGQAPGAEESSRGGAFIGPAGRQLTKFCASAGINRDTCRLDNVCQFFPEGDDLTPYIKMGTKNVKPTEIVLEQVEALKSRLMNTSANILVPLGNISMWALTGRVGITKWRGSILESTLLPGRKVIPTIHPSATLKAFGANYLSGHFIVYDLIRVKKECEFPDIRLRNRSITVSPTIATVRAFLQECSKAEAIAYDIETRGKSLSHIAFAINPDLAMCIPFVDGAKDVWLPDEEAEIMRLIAKLLEDEKVHKVGQNLSFDCTFMYREYGIHVRPIHDTMLAAAILFPDFPKGLDFLVSVYCDGEPYYKDDGKEWIKNPFSDEDSFRRYNAMDAATLLEIFPKQTKELKTIGNWNTYIDKRDLVHPLVYAGDRGLPVDTAAMKREAEECTVRLEGLYKDLKDIVGPQLNINSNPQLLNYFYVVKGLKPYTKRRKQGGSTPTVDEKALSRIASHGLEEARIILEIRREEKRKGTYLEVNLDTDNRFRCSYNPVGTKQERISSSKTIWGTGSNFQNIPHDVLKMFASDPGGVLVCQDLAQAENRYVAYEVGELKMIEALEEGVDIHTLTGCLVHSVPIDKCTPEIRQDGKKANHGLNYGLGIDNFIIQYELDYEQGKWIWNRYHTVYSSIKEGHAAIRDELAKRNRILVNYYGRSRRFLDQWGPGLFEKAYNYRPQSAIATKMNNDGVKYIYYNQELFPEVEFVNTVHDSVWYWIPISSGYERIIEIFKQVKKQLETPLTIRGRSFSIPVDTKIGVNLDEEKMIEWKAKDTDLSDSNISYLAEELETHLEQASS